MSHGHIRVAGRTAIRICELLKSRIASGQIGVGQYLPCVRKLGREHRISPETARRALKIMEADHWVRVHPGHGFKVTARGNDPAAASPVALVIASAANGGRWSDFCRHLQAAIERSAETRGWPVLALAADARRTGALVEQLRAARAAGMLLDTPEPKLVAELRRLGMPAVMVEETGEGLRLDCVTQDNFGGASAAARYLAGRGHRRIGWYGGLVPTVASRERWGGAIGALREAEAGIAPEHTVNSASPDGGDRLRAVFAGPDCPTALLALWWGNAVAAAQTLAEAGIAPGRDVEIVSWCPEELLPNFRAAYPGGRLPAAMTWSMRQMADAALARLAERRERPDMPPLRMIVETRLLEPETD